MEDESEDDKSKRKMREAMTEDERVMSEMIDNVFEHASNPAAAEQAATDGALACELDPANVGTGGEDEVENEDEDEEENESSNDNTEVDVSLNKEKIKVRLSAFNENCVKDIFELGKEMMKKKDLVSTRVRQKEREDRELAFTQRLRTARTGKGNPRFEMGMARLRK